MTRCQHDSSTPTSEATVCRDGQTADMGDQNLLQVHVKDVHDNSII